MTEEGATPANAATASPPADSKSSDLAEMLKTYGKRLAAVGGAAFWLGVLGIASKYGQMKLLLPSKLSPFTGDNPKKVVETYWAPGLQFLISLGSTLLGLFSRHIVLTLAILALWASALYLLWILAARQRVGSRSLLAVSAAALIAGFLIGAPWMYFENILSDDVATDRAFGVPNLLARPAVVFWRAVACDRLEERVVFTTLSGGSLDCTCGHADAFQDTVQATFLGQSLLAVTAGFPILLIRRRGIDVKAGRPWWQNAPCIIAVLALAVLTVDAAYIYGKAGTANYPSIKSAERRSVVFYLDDNTAYSPRTAKTWTEKKPSGTSDADIVTARLQSLVANAARAGGAHK